MLIDRQCMKQSPMVKTTSVKMRKGDFSFKVTVGFSMFKWKKHPGERQLFEYMGLALFQPLPSTCVHTEHIIAFCINEHSREEVTPDTSPSALP